MIYIVFNDSDIKSISEELKEGDCIIGDVKKNNFKNIKIIKPSLDSVSAKELISSLNYIFKDLSYPHIKGFINDFYEKTIVPIASYIDTLDRLLKEEKKSNNYHEIIFTSKILNPSFESVFFMSEHETQIRFLYKRQLIFQPYLEIYCKQNNIRFSFLKQNKISNLFITIPFRKLIVYFYRLYKSVYNSLFSVKNKSSDIKSIDFIAVTRLARKSEYIAPLLTKIGLKPVLYCEENFINFKSNKSFCKKYFNNNSFPITSIYSIGFTSILKKYLKSFYSIFKIRNFKINFKGVDINLNNALNEVLINNIDLNIYIESFTKSLQLIPNPRLKLLITTELKSQYAYADSFIAKSHGFSCFQIMDCDQSDNLIPQPVFGDYFFTNTKTNLINFKKKWSTDIDKILFFGNLTYSDSIQFKSISKKNNTTFCFFTSSRRYEDRIVSDKLYFLHKKNIIRLIIKLHPRDNYNYYKKYKSVEIINDYSLSRLQIFNKFYYGLTFSSAVVNDLMIYNKPFLLINLITDSNFNDNIYNFKYKKLNISINKLSDLIKIMDSKLHDYKKYQAQYISDIKDSKTLLNFKKKINSLQKR